ncbi:hypothetical protein BDQ17DRAFT_1251952, partial [Cyathus striatus]
LQFLESCIQRTPDIYLEELQEELQEARDVFVSRTAILRALKLLDLCAKKYV